jgi:hypothetical protein
VTEKDFVKAITNLLFMLAHRCTVFTKSRREPPSTSHSRLPSPSYSGTLSSSWTSTDFWRSARVLGCGLLCFYRKPGHLIPPTNLPTCVLGSRRVCNRSILGTNSPPPPPPLTPSSTAEFPFFVAPYAVSASAASGASLVAQNHLSVHCRGRRGVADSD